MDMEFATAETYLDAFYAGVKPDPRQTVDEWLEAESVQLPSFVAESGKYRTSRTPFWKEVYQCLSPSHPCSEVVVMKSHQIGATTVAMNWIGYIIDRAPTSVMIMEPTLDVAKKLSKQKLQPMLDLTPCLRGKVREARSRDSGNTVLLKTFRGGMIMLVGSNSGVGMRFASTEHLIQDEYDAYEEDAGSEGDPGELGENRQSTFSRGKTFKLSTPLDAKTSRIEPAYLAGSRGRFHVPCPHCAHMQHLRLEQLIYTFDEVKQPARAAYQCEGCHRLIDEHHKSFMFECGYWVHEDPENPIRSFHINSLYMPYGWRLNWARIATRHIRAIKKARSGDRRALKVFDTTIKAVTWNELVEKVDKQPLMKRREHYAAPCPDGVLVITAAIDVQGNRLESEKVGWGLGEQSWSLGYRIFVGEPSQQSVWDDCAAWLQEPLTHECGVAMSVQNVVVDTGGHHTQEAYEFVRSYRGGRICAIKGSSEAGAPVVPTRASKQKKAKLFLWLIGTIAAKDTIFPRLRIDQPGPGYMHFPDYPEYDEEYFDQLTSEVKKPKHTKRQVMIGYYYEKEKTRNEALDLKVYNWAALKLLRVNLEALAAQWTRQVARAVVRRPSSSAPPLMVGPARVGRRVLSRGVE